mgnify:FL=1
MKTQAHLEKEYFKPSSAFSNEAGMSLVKRLMPSVVAAIRLLRESQDKKRGPKVEAIRWLKDLNLSNDQIAFLCVQSTLCQLLGSEVTTLQQVALKIFRGLIDTAQWNQLCEEVDRRVLDRALKGRSLQQWSLSRNVQALAEKKGVYLIEYPRGLAFPVGKLLVHLLDDMEIVEIHHVRRRNSVSEHVRLSDRIANSIESIQQMLRDINIGFLPMVEPPVDWEPDSPKGGYYTISRPMVKSWSTEQDQFYRELPMCEHVEALNKAQRTRWAINLEMLEDLDRIVKTKQEISTLPSFDERANEQVPAYWDESRPFKEVYDEDPERMRKWKQRRLESLQRYTRNKSKRILFLSQLETAKRFSKRVLWFPHQLCFRGRMYPMPIGLNTQSSEAAKSLLEFADHKPFSERARYWLLVHLANCWGEDKVSFEARIEWAESNLGAIRGLDLWQDADKPLLFLRACHELNYAERTRLTCLPIPMDGSCNGLQHISALLRDPVGAHAVNLTKTDEPQDVYSLVLKHTLDGLRKLALDDRDAALMLAHSGRWMTKRNCMTTPYGVTRHGMEEQLAAEMTHMAGLEHEIDVSRSAKLLAELNAESIRTVVSSAERLKSWCESVVDHYGSSEPIRWSTPSGFRVSEEYKKTRWTSVRTLYGGTRYKTRWREPIQELDIRRQKQGLTPNLIHSLDASHMCLAINRMETDSFALVHDSFGVHAGDTDRLHEVLRETFVEMYEQPLLERLHAELIDGTPRPPEVGTWEPSSVLKAKYFFA